MAKKAKKPVADRAEPREVVVPGGHLPEWDYEVEGAYVSLTYKLRTQPPPAPITRIELTASSLHQLNVFARVLVLDGHHQADVVTQAIRAYRMAFHAGFVAGAASARDDKRIQNSAAAEVALAELAEIAERLRNTAEGLRAWERNRRAQTGVAPTEPDVVHPLRAANRLMMIAERINSSTKGKREHTK